MARVKTLEQLKEFLGNEYNGTLVLYISGSQGVSYGWETVKEGTNFDTLDELIEWFQNWTADWCNDYTNNYIDCVSDYSDRADLDDALENGDIDEDEYYTILSDALMETIVECGKRYVQLNDKIVLEFDGCEFYTYDEKEGDVEW